MSTTEPTTSTSATLEEIFDQAHLLSIARRQLTTLVEDLHAQISALKAAHADKIAEAAKAAGVAWDKLQAAIQANPNLFAKPRKQAAHGIVFGIEMGKGKLEIPDEAKTVELIERHLPEQAGTLIAYTKAPVKDALKNLPAATLKRIGVNSIAGVDTVVIRAAKSDVDKQLEAFLKALVEELAD